MTTNIKKFLHSFWGAVLAAGIVGVIVIWVIGAISHTPVSTSDLAVTGFLVGGIVQIILRITKIS